MERDVTRDHIREIYKTEIEPRPEDISEEQEESPEAAGAIERGRDDEMIMPSETDDSVDRDSEEADPAFLHESVKTPKTDTFSHRVLKTLGAGVLLGAAACIVFYMLSPLFKSTFADNETVIISSDAPENETAGGNDDAKDPVADDTDDTDYEVAAISERLHSVIAGARHSIVTITGNGDQAGWFDGTYTDPGSVSGLIVAETGSDIMILTPSSIIEGASSISVTCYDGAVYKAAVRKVDNNTGLAIVMLRKGDLSNTTLNSYKVAEIGNSVSYSKGSIAIVMGSPFGVSGCEVCGTLTGKTGTSNIRDGNFQLLVTDIAGANNESGVLFDKEGKVQGIITPGASSMKSDVITAIPISDIKAVIELLANGTSVPYMGIRGMDIDSVTYTEQGVPVGIFVTDVEVDSPAMRAGIQAGDVIQSIAGTEILTLQNLRKELLKCKSNDTVRIRVRRPSAEGYSGMDLNVTLGSAE